MADHSNYDVIIIGGGPGGIGAAMRAVDFGLKAALVEKNYLGGCCVNVGCVPSKALLFGSSLYKRANDKKKLQSFGVRLTENEQPKFDLGILQEKILATQQLQRQQLQKLLEERGVTFYSGEAQLQDARTICIKRSGIEDKLLTTDNVIIAVGSRPKDLPSCKFDGKVIISSDSINDIREVPSDIVIIGTGAIGLELGTTMNRLGSHVTFLDFAEMIGAGIDADISQQHKEIMEKSGITFHMNVSVEGVDVLKSDSLHGDMKESARAVVHYMHNDTKEKASVNASLVFVCVGRVPSIPDSLKLIESTSDSASSSHHPSSSSEKSQASQIKIEKDGTFAVDENLMTSVENIFAIGDCVKGHRLAHKAEEDGIKVIDFILSRKGVDVENKLPSLTPSCTLSPSHIPCVIYTDPEIAFVGETEHSLEKAGWKKIDNKEECKKCQKDAEKEFCAEVFRFNDNCRDTTDEQQNGFIKTLYDTKTHRILGCHIHSHTAGDLIGEAVLAVMYHIPIHEFGNVPHAHPFFKSFRFMRKTGCSLKG
ncbi:putative dihydrolipoamide dehydrogenase [Monocercomonoides exilis]|uniref:putative dihydrolipoamide dehydrogenase n=1 Tax=Monocercomonoides exilis TaxID=2049356 RepID=UPI0035594A85|nr:putative dihydrolipoamide dehydrogenase [Monocercomonoides exilis]|eukprot:MONOS_1884.1-p1 / transcript=MONOS_1884.1 / gene=MONOS_1884 / organism=Monocercomonoides_exilis_PA203 / gene_product=unspecified product / transcript_product=unspecified product / location=Mono_scaffold00036:27501-30043(+) / protein_length=537 / sequence_SO=supercontig / SO=protein_coding / is_pseudo=false